MNPADILAEKELIIQQIQKYVPLLRRFFEDISSLNEYSTKLYNFEVNPIHQTRQKLVKSKIKKKFEVLFGKESKKTLQINLDDKLAFNIADHHQVLSHPFLISANVISSTHKFFRERKQDAIIVVSSGDVPPNNYFSRNGLVFHEKRVPIFSASERELCSYYISKRDFNLVERVKLANRWKEFDTNEQIFIQDHEKLLKSLNFDNCLNYIDQISVIVKNTWPLMFEEKLRGSLPELLYITQEELVTDCLIELLEDGDNFISKVLFDDKLRSKVLENFRGIVVSWNEVEGKGTHFFWRKYPGEERSIRMYLSGTELIPHDPRFSTQKIELNRENIIELLKKREIYPSLFLIFSYLNFYAGIRPLTGFGSAIYLERFKEAWIKTLQNSSFQEEIPLIEDISVSGLVAGVVLFFERSSKKLNTLYAHDILYNGGMKEDYLKKILQMPFNQLFSVGLADMYNYFSSKYIPSDEKIIKQINFDDLASITFDWI